jgi:hypothetical protein
MAFDGPFYSDFLLTALFSSATPMLDGLSETDAHLKGDKFLCVARSLLSKEMEKPSNIATIRACLARLCSC